MAEPTLKRGFATGVVASVAVHGLLAGGLLWTSAVARPTPPVPGPDELAIDLEEAPTPAVAETLPPEQAAALAAAGREDGAATDGRGPGEGESEATIEPAPQPPPPPPVPVPQASLSDTSDKAHEPDAPETPPEPDAAPHRDAGVAVAAAPTTAPPGDAATGTEAPGTPGPGGEPAAGASPPVSESARIAGANLLAYFPPEHTVAVLLRFDRMRGTEWAEATEAVIRPMPDYEILIGKRDLGLADFLDALTIASTDPNDVTATTLVGRSSMQPAEVRALLDQPSTPVDWVVARGGALGKRTITRAMHAKDTRTYLTPFPGWFVLTMPQHLGTLVEPSSEGTLDAARASTADLPDWLSRVRAIEDESGKDRGPALMLTLAEVIDDIDLPGILVAPAPQRITMALEIDPKGLVVRGSLRFATAAAAATFAAAAEAFRDDFATSRVGKAMLAKVNAYNAVAGLTVVADGARIAYGTSVSIADARAILAAGARFMERRYAEKKAESAAAARTQPEKRAAKKKAAADKAAADKAAADKAVVPAPLPPGPSAPAQPLPVAPIGPAAPPPK